MTRKEKMIAVLVGINIALYLVHLYFPLLSSGFIWDDFIFYKSFAASTSTGGVLHSVVFNSSNFFRPLGTLSFFLECKLFGVNPVAAHAVNIALHLCTILLLYIVGLSLLRRKQTAAIAIILAACFAAFIGSLPTMSEPVAWIAGRFDSLCALFLLLLIATLISSQPTKIKFSLIFLFAFLALCSKETAITALPVATLFQLMINWDKYKTNGLKACLLTREFAGIALAISIATVCYGALRYFTQGGAQWKADTFNDISHAAQINLIAVTLKHWAQFLFIPWTSKLLPFYPPDFNKTVTTRSILTIAIAIIIVALIATAILRKASPKACVLGIFIVAVTPTANIVPIFPLLFSTAPRYLYIPILLTGAALLYSLTITRQNTNQRFHRAGYVIAPAFLLAGLIANHGATRNFISIYSTNDKFWSTVTSNIGVYNWTIAINAIDSKLGVYQYSRALTLYKKYHSEKLLTPSNDAKYKLLTAYFNHQSTPELVAFVNEIIKKKEKQQKGDQVKVDLPLSQLYNMKALMQIQLCASSTDVLKSAQSAQSADKNPLSTLLLNLFGQKTELSNKNDITIFQSAWLEARKRQIGKDLAQCNQK